MGPEDKLASLREAALLDIDKLDDETLLGKDLDALAEKMALSRYLEAPQLRRAVITPPRAVRRGEPGGPGREHDLVIRPATAVELWLLVDGFDTLVLLADGDRLDLGEADLDAENQCLSVSYSAEHPAAEAANAYFQACLDDVQRRLDELRQQIDSFNEGLRSALAEALGAARSRAKERRTFAAALVVPQPTEISVV